MPENHHTSHCMSPVRAAVVLAATCLSLLVSASLASAASFEQVGCFAGGCEPVANEAFPEETQLGGLGGMAVNYSGAGGVPAGTVYAVMQGGTETRVAMFEPVSGGLKFVQAWVITVGGGAYEICGPPGELPSGATIHPSCLPQANGGAGKRDIDVNQTTGNVYVFSTRSTVGAKTIVEFSADGGEEITRFGEQTAEEETVAESPAKVHQPLYPGGMAVNAAGDVYLYDANNLGSAYHRLMVFRPETPGDYAHYVYAGEVLAGAGEGNAPTGPAIDDAGNILVGAGGEGETLKKFAPETPHAFPSTHAPPICSFNYEKGGITSATVNPQTGEPFFFSSKKPKLVHRLGICQGGEYKEVGTIAVAPERDELWGLTIDPIRVFSPGRSAGVLYAGAPSAIPGSGIGKGQPGQSSLGYIFAPAVEEPPEVEAESVSKVRSTSATLRAMVDPKSYSTNYVFQYLSEADYVGAGGSFAGAAEAPIGGATIEGTGARLVAVTVVGLSPDTAYRFRVVAKSKCKTSEPAVTCETDGVGAAFHTFAAPEPGLSGGRAWELVSPAQKQGGQVLPADPLISSCTGEVKCKPGATYQHFPMQAAPDGEAVAYEGTTFGAEAALAENQYVSRRTGAGWTTANPTPSLLLGASQSGYRSLSTDLEQAVLGQPNPALSPAAPPEYENLYAQPTAEPLSLEPLVQEAPPHRPPSGSGRFEVRYAGASTDGSRVFFEANDALTGVTPAAPAAKDGGAKKFNLYEWFGGELALVNVKPGNATAPAGATVGGGPSAPGHAISSNGNSVFWSDETGQVYVRIGGSATRKIENLGKFLSASADGSRVLLRNGCLYAVETEVCVDLTAGKGGFQGVVGQSEDLSHVYFVDTEVLTGEEENSEGAKAQAGKFNLYGWVEGTTGFVATLAAGDNGGGSYDLAHDWVFPAAARTGEASPGGRYVTFLSQAQLTGYENTGPCESDHAGGRVDAPCPEAYVYDSVTQKLACASCNLSEAPPLGLTVLRLIMGPLYLSQPQYLTDSGRLYFDSQDSLVAADTNEGAEDVYEWRAEGVGGCAREQGCVDLLSGGREGTDSNFLAADPTGANVFFTTRDQLVGADTDELIDLYDARVGGGFYEPGALPPCREEACQPPPPAATEPPPASATVTGPGNVKPPKCKKGTVKRKGKCVKKNKHQRGAAKHKGGRRTGGSAR